jgi:mannose-6-phosphate isomerase-like protein (cupin superfamily)
MTGNDATAKTLPPTTHQGLRLEERMTKPWQSLYNIHDTTILAETQKLRVLDMTLRHQQEVPWHRHPANDDLFIGLRGSFDIHFGDEGEMVTVEATGRHTVPRGVPHRVVNRRHAECQFLLIQGGGPYSYLALELP